MMTWKITKAGRWGKDFCAELRDANGYHLWSATYPSIEDAREGIARMTGKTEIRVICDL